MQLQNKVDLVKQRLGHGNHNKSTNYSALCEVFDWYLATNYEKARDKQEKIVDQKNQDCTPMYQYVTKEQAQNEEVLYIGTVTSLKHLMLI